MNARHTALALLCLCLVLTGCSCGAEVLDTSRTVDDAGTPHHQQTGGAGGSSEEAGVFRTDAELDAGDGLIRPRSGRVVQVSGLVSEDGHPAVVQIIRDGVHGVDCAVTLARDGTARCLPADRSLSVRYSDPGCQNPVAQGIPSADPCTGPLPIARFAVEPLDAQCPAPGAAVFAVGAPVPAPDQAYYRSAFGCDPLTDPPPFGARYFEATPSPSGEWVAFEHRVKKITDRLGVGYWDGKDGARLIDSAWLLEENAPCRQETDPSGSKRCVPSRRTFVDANYFTDGTCGTPVAVTVLCDTPDLLQMNDGTPSSSCEAPTISGTLHTASPIDSTLVYSTSDGACSPTKYGGFKYYAPGAVVQYDSFPSIEQVPEGAGRLQPLYWASEGKHLYVEGLYDSTFGAHCTPALAGTETVCQTDFTTGGLGAYGYDYADGACTVPLFVLLDAPGCPSSLPSLVPEIPGDLVRTCGLPHAYPVRRVLGPHVGLVFQGSGFTGPSPAGPSICSRNNGSPAPVTYDVGPRLEPAQAFAALTMTDF